MLQKNILLLLLMLAAWSAWGQTPLKGIVLGSDGVPLVGATVQVKNTAVGATTDPNGAFTLDLPPGDQVLIVRFVGYGSREVTVQAGMRNVEITLEEGVTIRETVVTALGISRERKSLGYAVQELNGQDLAKNQSPNLLSTLQGKLAGVQVISAASQVGASARVVIRGNSSIFGNNQPLFVVNGVPADNSSFSPVSIYGGVDFGNAMSDFSADDIERISVLKGPAAAALYGSRASTGVILITTKTGKNTGRKGLGVTYSGNFGFTKAFHFWKLQDQFGQGQNQQFRYVDGTGAQPGNLYDGTDESWGPAFDARINEHDGIDNNGDGQVDEPNEGALTDQYYGKQHPWQAHPNSLLKSLDTGLDFTNHIAITSSGENLYARFSYTNFSQTGIIPNTDLKRNSFNLSFGAKPAKKLSTDANITYVRTDSKNRPPISYTESFVFESLWTGRQVDWVDLRNKRETVDELGRNYNWNHNFYTNPFWDIYHNLKPFDRDRINGYYALGWALTDWLKLKGRIGNDFAREYHKQYSEIGHAWHFQGRLQEDNFEVNERNAELLLTAERHFGERFSLLASAGANRENRMFRQHSASVEALVVPGVFNFSNANGNPTVTEYTSKKVVNSVYGNLSIGYRSWLFVDLSARNDWSSTLPPGAASYFYPSVNVGLVLSEVWKLGNQLNFLKLRGGWAKVGNDTDPYQLRSSYSANPPWSGLPSFTVPDVLPNFALKPESKISSELGVEALAFGKRLGLDIAVYNSEATDQILPVDASPTTGFNSRIINAGTIRNRGAEVQLSAAPVQTPHVSWNIRLNWAKNKSKVLDLPEGVDAILIGDNGGCHLEAREGEEFGVLYGTRMLRNPEGKLILKDGLPQIDPVGNVRLGSISPDWIGGIQNSFSWKNWTLDVLVDARFGNQFLSWTILQAHYSGAFEETLEGRRNADEVKNGYAFDGVIDNGDGTYRTNDVKVSAQAWNKTWAPWAGGGFDRGVLDGSFVKLREINLTWALPASLAAKLRAQQIRLGLFARNVAFLYTGQPHFDPEFQYTPNNADQGWEVMQYPATRTFGVQINAGF